jgi:hypothetical protein
MADSSSSANDKINAVKPTRIEQQAKLKQRLANDKVSKSRKEYMANYYKNKKEDIRLSRLVSRIAKGNLPTTTTLRKYGLDPEFVNKVRIDNQMDPTDNIYPATVINYTTEAELAKLRNERAISEAKKIQLGLAKQIDNSTLPLDMHHELGRELERIHNPGPIANELHYDDVKAYFERLYNYQLKHDLQKSMNETTIRKRIGQWAILFTEVIGVDKANLNKVDIIKALLDLTPSKIKARYPNVASASGMVEAVLVLAGKYPGLMNRLGPAFEQKWVRILNEMKTLKQVDRKARAAEIYPPFSEILSAVEKAYGQDSDQGLLINFYNEHTLRDDYGDIMIVEKEDDIPNTKEANRTNWMAFNGRSAILLLREYKTNKKYGEKRLIFSKKVVGIMKKLGIKPGMRLYEKTRRSDTTAENIGDQETDDLNIAPGDEHNNEVIDFSKGVKNINFSLSQYIGKMLDGAGFIRGKNRRGAVNFLRHAKVSEALADKSLTDSQRIMLAYSMGHSIDTQEDYKRTLSTIKKDYKDVAVDQLPSEAVASFEQIYGQPSQYQQKKLVVQLPAIATTTYGLPVKPNIKPKPAKLVEAYAAAKARSTRSTRSTEATRSTADEIEPPSPSGEEYPYLLCQAKAEDTIRIPSKVKKDASIGLKMIQAGYKGGTSTGLLRANQLAECKYLSVHALYNMKGFFQRHMFTSLGGYLKWEADGKPVDMVDGQKDERRGAIAILIWGGIAAFEWLRSDAVQELLAKYHPKGKNELETLEYYKDKIASK